MIERHWSAGYIGIPYELRGRTRAGLDCWGLCWLALTEQLGIDVPSYTEVPASAAELEELAAAIAGIANGRPWRRVERPREFDVAVFRHGALERHTGLVAGDGLMLHIVEGSLSSLSRYGAVHWRSRLVGFYRHEALTGPHDALRGEEAA